MVVEIAETAHALCRPADLLQEPLGLPVTLVTGDAEDLFGIGIADEMRIERLAVAGDRGQGVQVRLEKVGSGPHLREHHEIVETFAHRDLFLHQVGFALRPLAVPRRGIDREVAHQVGVHPVVLEVLQELTEAGQILEPRRLGQPA